MKHLVDESGQIPCRMSQVFIDARINLDKYDLVIAAYKHLSLDLVGD